MATSSDQSARPRASIVGSFIAGWRLALSVPWVTAGLIAATLLVAAPLSAVIGSDIPRPFGTADVGAGTAWIVQTVSNEIAGFGGALVALSRWLDVSPRAGGLDAAIAVYLLLDLFLAGGVLDRLARGRPVGAAAFFAACGGHAGRFLRLSLVTVAVWWVATRALRPLLLGTPYELVIPIGVGAASLIVDFARVRTVVEDRRSMLGALAASLRFIRRRVLRVAALVLINGLGLAAALALGSVTAPPATAAPWLALFASGLFLVIRAWMRLAFVGSEIAFFQGELAHANYTAASVPMWPESPAVEAIRNLARARRATGPTRDN